MFTAAEHKNLADAESYFDEHLAQNDYYAAGEIRPGHKIGADAEGVVSCPFHEPSDQGHKDGFEPLPRPPIDW
jgi:hypothetical protein